MSVGGFFIFHICRVGAEHFLDGPPVFCLRRQSVQVCSVNNPRDSQCQFDTLVSKSLRDLLQQKNPKMAMKKTDIHSCFLSTEKQQQERNSDFTCSSV